MRLTRMAVLAATVFAAACSSDEATSPTPRNIETRLTATASVPTAVSVSDATVNVRVAVTSALPEAVSGGVCAQTIEARAPGGTTWTDVTSSSGVCSAQAVLLSPGATIDINAIADQAKARTVAGSGTSVVLRARHTMTGASASYVLQSNEVTWTLP